MKNFIFPRKIILYLFFFYSSQISFGQESIRSTIYIYSNPDDIKITIPELALKIKKNSRVYELNDLIPESYNLIFQRKGKKLKIPVNIKTPDTFMVYADMLTNEVVAVTKSEFLSYLDENPSTIISLPECNAESEIDSSLVFFIVEDMPTFNGGEPVIEFTDFIIKQLHYPTEAAKRGISGTVVIQFVVDRNGNVIEPVVTISAHPLLDKEALRVISSSPRWSPGKQRGQAVNVAYTWPVRFLLN